MDASGPLIGYCTNVHAGVTLAEIRQNLQTHAADVRDRVSDARGIGVGLWIPASAAAEMMAPGTTEQFRDWLAQQRLVPYTLNGFPYDNFHREVVKHRVYRPTWQNGARRDYTLTLIQILHRLLPDRQIGSISTLPIGWGNPPPTGEQQQTAATHLIEVATALRRLEETEGRWINVALEPEPGCALSSTDDLLRFFNQYLPDPWLRRYLTVCHDVCHAAVMGETQSQTLAAYRDAGIVVGKVQVSAAIAVDWSQTDGERARRQLHAFAEDRYLHQTGVVDAAGTFQLFEDLPELLKRPATADRSWTIHFHMPIYLRQFGALATTQDAIVDCLRTLRQQTLADPQRWTGHFEVETYAWTVLPAEMRPARLGEGIANEIVWLRQTLQTMS